MITFMAFAPLLSAAMLLPAFLCTPAPLSCTCRHRSELRPLKYSQVFTGFRALCSPLEIRCIQHVQGTAEAPEADILTALGTYRVNA